MVRIFRNKTESYSKLTDTYLKFITSIDTIFFMSFSIFMVLSGKAKGLRN